MYRRDFPEPIDRNREIYEAVRYNRQKQKDVAETYGLTQPMISKIVSRYEEWIVAHAPNEDLEPHEREFLAANTWCEVVTRGQRMAMDGYEASLEDRLLKPEDGVRGRWIPAKPDMKCVKTVMDSGEKFFKATTAREGSRRLLIMERDRHPQHQAEVAERERARWREAVAEQKRRDREAAERETNVVITSAGDAKPDLGSGDVRTAERADDISTMAESAPQTNAAQSVINSSHNQAISAENSDSRRLYEFADSETLMAESSPYRPQPARPVGESDGELESRVTERENNVVVTLRRDDITGVTTPVGDAKPDLRSGDVRTAERADDIPAIYWARDRKAPPGYAPVNVKEWHGLEPPEDAVLKWRPDYPQLAPMVCSHEGELMNCYYLCDVVDPVQAELDRAAGIKPEQLYCWLTSREINSRSRDELLAYARKLWRERGYCRRSGVGSLSREPTSQPAEPVSRKTPDPLSVAPPTAPATREDRMLADRMISQPSEQPALASAALPTAAPRSRFGLKETPSARELSTQGVGSLSRKASTGTVESSLAKDSPTPARRRQNRR